MTLFVSVNRALMMQRQTPFEIRQSKEDTHPQRVASAEFTGTIRLVWIPDSPMQGGAVCWLEIDPAPTEP